MPNITALIEGFLLDMLGDDEKIVINRNQLADYFECAPSQINYVLSTRFTIDRGFLIESQRGSGGSVTVSKVNDEEHKKLTEIIDFAAGEGISFHRAQNIIDRAKRENLIDDEQAKIIRVAVSDKSLMVPNVLRDHLRANILKNVMNHIIKGG